MYGVEAGTRVLLLAAVWVTRGVSALQFGAQSWGPPPTAPQGPGSRGQEPLHPQAQPRHTNTHTYKDTHANAHTQHCRTFQAAQFCPTLLYTRKLTTAPRGLYPNRLKFKHKPTATHRPGNAQQPNRRAITRDGSPTHRPAGSWRGRPQRAGLLASEHHSPGGLPASRSPPFV